MKSIILVALALAAVAVAIPVEREPTKIVRSQFDQQPDGAYVYSFETDDGSKRQETGEVKEALDEENKPQKVVIVRGSYSYFNPEGNEETITYVADENGYRAEGPSIPVAPEAAARR